MGSRKSALSEERGVTLVLMALMLFLALGMSALAIDYGMIKAAKAEAQRAMDAAALAGASAFLIPDPDADFSGIAEARAREFAKKHDVHRTPVTDPEVTVAVDLAKKEVKASYAGGDIPLWFANTFGMSTMRLSASATAKASESGESNCLKPVALPDMWKNVNNFTGRNNNIKEDKNDNGVWDAPDLNGNGVVDPGEFEPWTFNTGDIYDPPTYGYGTGYRNSSGSGNTLKTQDYGRQVLLQTFDQSPTGDKLVSSYFRTWQDNPNTGGTDSLGAGIRGERCIVASLGTEYQQANGGKEPLQLDWEYVINQDPSAAWNDGSNTVVGSSFGANWLDESPRVVVVGLYPPSYANSPSSNPIEFTNFAKIWIDQRPCSGAGGLGQCKNPITARFLGYVEGGAGGPVNGSLVYHIVLVK
jgi:putative Flp pilus-assembly TadE/G-like protein